MFEDFPYSNLHQLNLDWLVDVVEKLHDNMVISVNGQTGEVILYQNATMQLPNVDDRTWTILRNTHGVKRGIKFDSDGTAYIVSGNSLASVFTPENPPASSQVTYDQYVRLTTLTDEQMHNWNIFRTLNDVSTGIEFDDTGEAYIISGSNRYRLYSTKNPNVSSVNGQTGDVVLYTDSNGEMTLPGVTNPNVDAWSIGRTINGTACRIYIYDDGQVTITAGNDEYRLVNSEELDDLAGEVSDLKNAFDGAITTHANLLQNAEYYDNYYWKRTSPLGRSSSSNHRAYYGIPVTGGKTYYYKHLFLYYTVIVYSGQTAPTTLTDDTTQDVSGTFTPSSNGTIYITINKANSPLFTDDAELYGETSLETYYTPNKLIVSEEEEKLTFTLTNGKAISNTTGNESTANTYWNASSFVDISGYQKIKVFSAFQNSLAAAFYDKNQTFIVGVPYDSSHNGTAYEYNLDTPPSAKYIRFTVYTYQSGVTADTAYIKGVIEQLDDVNADLKSIDNVLKEPVSNLPVYVKGLLSYRPIGCLDKGYVCITCDDGSAGLATYTIPMLTAKQVPATFGLFATSDVITNNSYLETVLGAIENGCEVAMHGVASWSTYSEYYLNKYFDETETVLNGKGITNIHGAICPGVGGYDDTTELVRCVAGGRYKAVCSGGTHGEISYGSYYCAGKRTNIFAMRRISIIRLTEAQYKAAIDYAYDNHLIFMPFFHDYDVVDSAEYKAIIEGMIDYAKSKGLTFITMKDLPTIK